MPMAVILEGEMHVGSARRLPCGVCNQLVRVKVGEVRFGEPTTMAGFGHFGLLGSGRKSRIVLLQPMSGIGAPAPRLLMARSRQGRPETVEKHSLGGMHQAVYTNAAN